MSTLALAQISASTVIMQASVVLSTLMLALLARTLLQRIRSYSGGDASADKPSSLRPILTTSDTGQAAEAESNPRSGAGSSSYRIVQAHATNGFYSPMFRQCGGSTATKLYGLEPCDMDEVRGTKAGVTFLI